MRRPWGVLVVLAWLTGCSAGQPSFVDLADLERPETPNTYLVCPPEHTSAPVDRAPPVYDVPRARLERVWLDALAEAPRVTPRGSQPERHRHLFVQRTRVLRFPDVVQIAFLEVPPDRSTLCVYSRSVYGRYDFGENRRRVEDWIARFRP